MSDSVYLYATNSDEASVHLYKVTWVTVCTCMLLLQMTMRVSELVRGHLPSSRCETEAELAQEVGQAFSLPTTHASIPLNHISKQQQLYTKTSTKAADDAKVLLLNECHIEQIQQCRVWLPKCNGYFPVQRYISGIIFMKIQSVFCLFVCLGFNGTFSTNRLYRAITVG